ncbi:hypothetical protein CBR_g12766 [Chara braunii]|uniref:C2HC zinc finger plants domain-containing protein n=1 Tax=Chara braunii TaxID=69332 RepID=A0A388KSS1_CHABU|nr:hypothetical protein CBR_g12766 [Chara braunii]|eukprot:GBG73048.1 hypothetical protein CBR_g12766 [Chara braunii]
MISLLAFARQKIQEGQPTIALQAVVSALQAIGGEAEVFRALDRARCLYHQRNGNMNLGPPPKDPLDELTNLFAHCALVEKANVFVGNGQGMMLNAGADADGGGVQERECEAMEAREDDDVNMFGNSSPILAESGRLQVVRDASADNSSFTCSLCGGVLSSVRRDEHRHWCTGGVAR